MVWPNGYPYSAYRDTAGGAMHIISASASEADNQAARPLVRLPELADVDGACTMITKRSWVAVGDGNRDATGRKHKIADPKVVTAFNDTRMAQLLGYLYFTVLNLARLLNFNN